MIKGYFNFYEFDKVDRKTRLFKLNLMDENLNPIGTKEIEGPKEWELISSGFDGNNFCFKFWNEKTKAIELKVYDQAANEVNSITNKVNYNPKGMKATSFAQGVSPEININDNAGFVDYTFDDKTDSFFINYIGADQQKNWDQSYVPETKTRLAYPNYLTGNSDMIITSVTRFDKGMYNTKTQTTLLANSTKDGSLLFDIPMAFEDDNYVVPINAIFEDGKLVVIGINYKKAKTMTSPPDGLAFLELDKTGKILKSNFKTFDESLGKFLTLEDGKLEGDYYMFIHNIVKTDHNTNLVIGEKFKKNVNKTGAVFSALALAGGSAGGGFSQLKLENMVVIEYDKDGNALQAQEIPKAEGTTSVFPSYMGFFSPYLLATAANMLGWMDYMYTTKTEDNSEINFSFVDYDKLEDADKKTQNFGTIKYKGGKVKVDKIAIKKDKATWARILPGKANHVIQVNYYKKEKKLTMELVKLG